MAFDTIIDKTKLESALTASANVIREKTGSTEPIAWLPDKGFADAIGAIKTGGGGATEEEWIKDGNTHVWITLKEGRTSPMLGVCPNGTVTVDWGDGTTPDVLTGTSTSSVKWTPTHNYAEPGDYVITLTVDGTMGFYGNDSSNQYSGILRYAAEADTRNTIYQVAVKKVEIGNKVTLRAYAFNNCYSLASVIISEGVAAIGAYAFNNCYSLASVVIPKGVTTIREKAFYNCYSLASVVIPKGVTTFEANAFAHCYSLASVIISEGVAAIGAYAFNQCRSLASVIISEGVTAIGAYAFSACRAIAKVVIPKGVTSIGGNAFSGCFGARYFDFTYCTTVPALYDVSVFNSTADDLEIRVPAALYDEWIAETNWSSIESCIKAGQGGIA